MAKKSLVKTHFDAVLAEHQEQEGEQEDRNASLLAALELFVAHCGGDMTKPTKAQSEAFGEALALWVIESSAE